MSKHIIALQLTEFCALVNFSPNTNKIQNQYFDTCILACPVLLIIRTLHGANPPMRISSWKFSTLSLYFCHGLIAPTNTISKKHVINVITYSTDSNCTYSCKDSMFCCLALNCLRFQSLPFYLSQYLLRFWRTLKHFAFSSFCTGHCWLTNENITQRSAICISFCNIIFTYQITLLLLILLFHMLISPQFVTAML